MTSEQQRAKEECRRHARGQYITYEELDDGTIVRIHAHRLKTARAEPGCW